MYHIKEAVVSAKQIQKEIIPVQILSGAALQKLSVHSVADALRYFSGVQIKDYGGIGGLKTVNIRSMGTQHVGVFYDGIELGNAQNGTIDLGRFSLDNMESISLYNGQRSAIFQSAKDFGSAGSIYMVSRIPRFVTGKKYNAKLTFKTGSFGLANPSFLLENRLSTNVNSSLSAEYMYTNGRYKFSYRKKNGYDTTEVRKNGDVYSIRAEYGLFGKIREGEWKAKAYFYNSERGYPGASVREEPGKFKNQDRQWDSNFFLQGSFKKYFSRYSMLINGKYAYDYLHYLSDPRLDASTMYVNNHYRQQEIYLSSANLFSLLPGWNLNLSADFQWNKLNADLIDFVYPARYTGLIAIATAIHLQRLNIQASLLGTFVNDKTKVKNAAAGSKQEYTPTVILSWQPWEETNLNFRAFYKRIFRMPTLNDLYYTFIGNKDLNPEYTTQYDVGITYARNYTLSALNGLEIQVDGYYNEVTDKIIAMPTSNQFRWTMVNLGKVEIRGLDVALQSHWSFSRQWLLDARINYTYQKAQDFSKPGGSYYGDQIPYIPWHSGSIILNGSYKSWELNYSFIYTGKRYEASANIPENEAKEWYTNDLSASKTFLWKKTKVRLTAEVNNLLNQQYEVVQCYPMPGTNVKFTINIEI
ncbi:TonB-dependent receptor [uncultured Sanguibacteroides sp.]|uniref:TonB-dependent receptor n=1 Tax=uncultured Sanguibacteroides sp. TaxID=1635151 RepID=UPI0025F00A4E|nr:TonB-dependent receptor [uncultured Sanguibacteroides sp.]